MILEFLVSVFSSILNIINGFINTVSAPLTNALQSNEIASPSLTGYTAFSNACIITFVPYRQIIAAVAVVAPAFAINMIISAVNFVKSFIPLMGGD